MPIAMELTPEERKLLDALLTGAHPALAVLRAQLAVARIEQRELTGVGFFAHFRVPEEVLRVPVRQWIIGDVAVTHPSLEHGGGALLFVDAGVLGMLEAYSYGSEPWPEHGAGMETAYLTRGRSLPGGGFQIEQVRTRDEDWLAKEYATAEHRAAAS